jgi:small subunit ribosomal protein S4
MSIGPKVKISRRLGVALTSKAAKVMAKKAHPPGMHGPAKKMGRKMSDYKKQLLEKQKLRAQYNIRERQLRNYFRKAISKPGKSGDHLLRMLETRLDSLVLRSGFASTIYAARQYVSHAHFQINGKRVTSPSHTVKPNDVISVKPRSRKCVMFANVLDSASPPPYISLNKDEMSASLVGTPAIEDIPVIFDISQVVEFYSR